LCRIRYRVNTSLFRFHRGFCVKVQDIVSNNQEHIKSAMEKFGTQLQDPDHVRVRERDAMKQFGLTEQDLKDFEFTEKENPYEWDEKFVKQYWLRDVVAASLAKYQHRSVVEARFHRYLENESWRKHVQTVYGMDDVVDAVTPPKFWHRVRQSRKAMIGGLPSVQQGLLSNFAIAGLKGTVFIFTGSSEILADFMHSCADVGNYGYRYITILRSSGQEGDLRHPYGYDRLRSICADRSFFILLCLGGAVPMYAGLQALVEGDVFEGGWLLPVLMFAASGGLESLTLKASFLECSALAAKENMSFFKSKPKTRR